jgi:phosphohistidine phosphatase
MTQTTTRTLILMRHAEPVSSMEDSARPLSVQGRRQAELMASWIRLSGAGIEEVRSSDRLRARQTAEALGRRLELSPGRVREWKALAPDADPSIAVSDLESDPRNVALVGHLPHVERLASTLLAGDPSAVAMQIGHAAAVVLMREGERWTLRTVIAPSDVQALDQASRSG